LQDSLEDRLAQTLRASSQLGRSHGDGCHPTMAGRVPPHWVPCGGPLASHSAALAPLSGVLRQMDTTHLMWPQEPNGGRTTQVYRSPSTTARFYGFPAGGFHPTEASNCAIWRMHSCGTPCSHARTRRVSPPTIRPATVVQRNTSCVSFRHTSDARRDSNGAAKHDGSKHGWYNNGLPQSTARSESAGMPTDRQSNRGSKTVARMNQGNRI
jgi:hypothetical protein